MNDAKQTLWSDISVHISKSWENKGEMFIVELVKGGNLFTQPRHVSADEKIQEIRCEWANRSCE